MAKTGQCCEIDNPRSGMGLVGVVVSLFIFGACIAGICRVLVAVNQTSDLARDHYVAVNICKNRIERARAFDFAQIQSFAEDNVVVGVNGQPTSDGRFSRTTQILSAGTNLVEMIVTAAIRDRETWAFDGPSESIRTYIGDLQGPPE